MFSLGDGPSRVEIDIMEPIDPTRAPKVHVPPLNHIGLWVDDLKLALLQLSEKGMRFTPGGIRKGAGIYENYIFIYIYIDIILNNNISIYIKMVYLSIIYIFNRRV